MKQLATLIQSKLITAVAFMLVAVLFVWRSGVIDDSHIAGCALNCIAFLLIVGMSVVVAIGKEGVNAVSVAITAGALFYLFPQSNQLWSSTDAVNFLWPTIGTLVILLLLRHYNHRHDNPVSWVQMIALPVVGALCGWSHEAFALPLLAAMAVSAPFGYKRLTPYHFALVLGYVAGVALMILSPYHLLPHIESAFEGVHSIRDFATRGIYAFGRTGDISMFVWFLWIALIVMATGFKRYGSYFAKSKFLHAWLLMAVMFTCAIGYSTESSGVSIHLVSMLLLLRLFKSLEQNIKL